MDIILVMFLISLIFYLYMSAIRNSSYKQYRNSKSDYWKKEYKGDQ